MHVISLTHVPIILWSWSNPWQWATYKLQKTWQNSYFVCLHTMVCGTILWLKVAYASSKRGTPYSLIPRPCLSCPIQPGNETRHHAASPVMLKRFVWLEVFRLLLIRTKRMTHKKSVSLSAVLFGCIWEKETYIMHCTILLPLATKCSGSEVM